MVKHTQSAMTSSGYRLGPAKLFFRAWLPVDVTISGDAGRDILGALPEERSQHVLGHQPHVALANLPTFDLTGTMKTGTDVALRLDTKAAVKFVKDYGALHAKDLPRDPEDVFNNSSDLKFREPISDFESAQLQLRKVWSGDITVFFEIQKKLEFETFLEFPNTGFEALVDNAYPGARLPMEEDEVEASHGVRVLTNDLWTFIRLRFLADFAEAKIAVCANPNCLVPYFVKKRKSQKLCEQGECVAWAQRQYSLKWWNVEGKKRREKRHSKRQLRSKGGSKK